MAGLFAALPPSRFQSSGKRGEIEKKSEPHFGEAARSQAHENHSVERNIMGFIDYMILSERFQGIRRDCVRPSLVDIVILIKSLAPIALAYLFEIKLLVVFAYPICCALFLYFYLKREEEVLATVFDESSARYSRRPLRR